MAATHPTSMYRASVGLVQAAALLIGTVVLSAIAGRPSQAGQVPWPNEMLAYTVVDQELRDLLVEIGTRLGVRVHVSDAVKARVRGRLPPAPPSEFLTRLASIYGFEWFYYNGTIWVSSPSESQPRMMQLGPIPIERMTMTMDELGLSDERWPLRGSGQAGVVVVNGPPHFVTSAEQALAALQQNAHRNVHVFRGQPSRAP